MVLPIGQGKVADSRFYLQWSMSSNHSRPVLFQEVCFQSEDFQLCSHPQEMPGLLSFTMSGILSTCKT